MREEHWAERFDDAVDAALSNFRGLSRFEGLALPVRLDTGALQKDLARLSQLADRFSHTMSAAFARAVISGRRFSDVLRGLMLQLSRMALQRGFDVLFSGLRTAMGGFLNGLFASTGGVAGVSSRITAFAKGGVVASPQVFSLSDGGLGLMGEAGAEAILPLMRGPDGRLGVRAHGNGTAQVNVTMHITTPDAEGFRRNRGRIAAELARAVAEGQRQM
ncbi:phage tail tape measure protein [Thermopetrobacter sp. TC1]|uniref:phage tail tape measure protein n=1 Tax=Thermopetrobacter sp. TC1 TaxID=1495045 RepID=UPI000A9D2E69|nr:phage tail tape measure protein [Thermopetrobacter sp. TC1]